MGRRKEKPQVLFKNSNNTFNTYSKTCSVFSESITKSIITKLKKKIQNNNYYDDNGTVKRDLSIETDICILRRFIRENEGRMREHSSSARFKYSINNTNKDAIGYVGSKADSSACGDSQHKIGNAQLKVDLTTLVVDNLKTLLNDWIKKYLLENNKTKQKIATVLDSILHKVELEQTSSSGTYTLDVEVINEALTTDSTATLNMENEICLKRNSNRKLSSLTVPLAGKRVKLISTLSVPKSSAKYKKTKAKKTRIQYNKTSINKLLTNSSSYNVLEIRTESFTKRCATYQKPKWEKHDMQKKLYFKPQSSPTTISSIHSLNTSNVNNIEIIEDSVRNKCKSISKINELNRLENKDNIDNLLSTQNDLVIAAQYTKHDCGNNQRKNKITKKRPLSYPTFQSIKAKSFSYHCKNTSQKCTQQNEFLKHVKDIMKYFDKFSCINNINLDIQINVSPGIADEKVKGSSGNTHAKSDIENNTFIYNVKPKPTKIPGGKGSKSLNDLINDSNERVKIISLLDGAISQTKYLISRQISTTDSNMKIDTEKKIRDEETGTSGLDIIQDLGEIKKIIKDLVSVAENVVREHMNKKNIASEFKSSRQSIHEASKKSIAVQCLNTETKNILTSGLKLKKEPKKKETKDYNPRLTKKSTSYRIIESESILKIHDLTLIPQKIIETVTDEKLHAECLPKSQSLLEISPVAHNHKLVAFYCDKCIKARQCIFGACNHNVPYANMYPTCCDNDCKNLRHISIENFRNMDFPEDRRQLMESNNYNNCRIISRQKCVEADEDSNSVCLDIDRNTCDKKFVVTKRSVGFKEGCFYCIILWIPVLVIMWLFYVFTLKVFIESRQSSMGSTLPLFANNNSSEYPVSITDLGF